jgi:hypothetical protein
VTGQGLDQLLQAVLKKLDHELAIS